MTITQPTTNTVELSTGVTLPYVERGDPDGVPMLLLHGVTDSLRAWDPLFEQLPESFRAVAITQRGHSGADAPAAGYLIEDYAADAAAVIDALGLGPAIVVGASMGAWVAQQLVVDHPSLVRAVALVGPIGTGAAPAELEGLAAEMGRLEDPIPHEVALEFQVSTIERPIAPEQLDVFVRESLNVPARVWRDSFTGFVGFDVSGRLADVSAPVLIAHGDHDAFSSREEQDGLLELLPNARLSVYEGTGHAVHWEQPARLAAEIGAFLGQGV